MFRRIRELVALHSLAIALFACSNHTATTSTTEPNPLDAKDGSTPTEIDGNMPSSIDGGVAPEVDGGPIEQPCAFELQRRVRFEAEAVRFGESCRAEEQTQTCSGGKVLPWSGTYTHETCVVQPPRACDGAAHGTTLSRVAYREAVVEPTATCTSETQTRTCRDGTWSEWSGTFVQGTCAIRAFRSCGEDAPHATTQRRTRYAAAAVDPDQLCRAEEQTRTCNDGSWSSWSGQYEQASCVVATHASCGLTPHGSTETRKRFASEAAPYGENCTSELQTRTCSDGTFSAWSGSHRFDACRVAEPASCDGQAHGTTQSRTAFEAQRVAWDAQCKAEIQERTCQNGTFSQWTGTYQQTACAVAPPPSCEGSPHGTVETRVRYREALGPNDGPCVSEEQNRTCVAGTWSAFGGTFTHIACASCVDRDGDHFGTNCLRGPDCDDNRTDEYPGSPTTLDVSFDLADSDCDGKLGPHLTLDNNRSNAMVYGLRLLDDGKFVVINDQIRTYDLSDLSTPLYQGPFARAQPSFAQLRAHTLVVRPADSNDVVIYEWPDFTKGPVEKARLQYDSGPSFFLADDGVRLFVRSGSNQIEIFDLSTRSAPRKAGAFESDCSFILAQLHEDLLILPWCGPYGDTYGLTSYDVSAPESVERRAVVNYGRSLSWAGYHEGTGFFRYGSSGPLARRDLTTQTAELEYLNDVKPDERAVFASTQGGLAYVERKDFDLGAKLCFLRKDQAVPDCSSAGGPGELHGTYALLHDGNDLMLDGLEFSRRVRLSGATPTTLGRWLELESVSPERVENDRIFARTLSGIAVLNAVDFSPRTYVPIDSDTIRAVTFDGEEALVAARRAVLARIDLSNEALPRVKARTRSVFESYRHFVVHRADKTFLISNTGQTLYKTDLDDNQTMPMPILERRSIQSVADLGDTLLVNGQLQDGTLEIAEVSLEGTVSPLLSGMRTLHSMHRHGNRVYLGYQRRGYFDINTRSFTWYADAPGVDTFCSTRDFVFAITEGGPLYLLEQDRFRAIPVSGLPNTNGPHYGCLGGDDRLVLGSQGPSSYSVHIAEN